MRIVETQRQSTFHVALKQKPLTTSTFYKLYAFIHKPFHLVSRPGKFFLPFLPSLPALFIGFRVDAEQKSVHQNRLTRVFYPKRLNCPHQDFFPPLADKFQSLSRQNGI